MPGTEVAVRPKSRKSRVSACTDVQSHSSTEEKGMKAILRIQASKVKHTHKLVFGGVELGVVLTSVVYLHPETARKLSFDNLQLVVIEPRLRLFKEIKQRRGGNFSSTEGNTEGSSNNTRRARHTILRILYSDAVVKGHVMLPKAVCLHLRVGAHSCKKDGSLFSHARYLFQLTCTIILINTPCQHYNGILCEICITLFHCGYWIALFAFNITYCLGVLSHENTHLILSRPHFGRRFMQQVQSSLSYAILDKDSLVVFKLFL